MNPESIQPDSFFAMNDTETNQWIIYNKKFDSICNDLKSICEYDGRFWMNEIVKDRDDGKHGISD